MHTRRLLDHDGAPRPREWRAACPGRSARAPRLLVLNKEDATSRSSIPPPARSSAACRSARDRTSWSRPLMARRLRQQLRHRTGAGPHDLDDRHRLAEGTAAHRRGAARPARTASPSRAASCTSAPKQQEDRPLRSGHQQGRPGSSKPARTTHMVLPRRTRGRSSRRTSASTACRRSSSAGRHWTQTVIPVGNGPKASTCPLTAAGLERALARRRRVDHRRRGEESRCRRSTSAPSDQPDQADARRQVRADFRSRSRRTRRPRRAGAQGNQAPPAGKMPEGILIAPVGSRRVRRRERRQQHRRHRSEDPGR